MIEQSEKAVIKRLMEGRKGSKKGRQIGGKKIEGCDKGPLELQGTNNTNV